MRCSNRETEDPDCTIKNSQFEKLRRNLKRPGFRKLRLKMPAFGKAKVLPGGPWKRGNGETQSQAWEWQSGSGNIGGIVSIINKVNQQGRQKRE